MSVNVKDSGGNVLLGRSVAWFSANSELAEVTPTGLVTGVSPGTVTIRALSDGVIGFSTITISPPPVATVEISPSSAFIPIGPTAQLQATLRDASGNVLIGRSVTWSTSNSPVATVSEATGLVTAHAAGQAQIIAMSEGTSRDIQVTIPDPPQFVSTGSQFSPGVAIVNAQITLFGTHFDGPELKVTFGETPAPAIDLIQANQIVVRVPSGVDASVQITVTTVYGTATSTQFFILF